jgi:hypothetical protein
LISAACEPGDSPTIVIVANGTLYRIEATA